MIIEPPFPIFRHRLHSSQETPVERWTSIAHAAGPVQRLLPDPAVAHPSQITERTCIDITARCSLVAPHIYCPRVGLMLGQRLRRWPNINPTRDRGLWLRRCLTVMNLSKGLWRTSFDRGYEMMPRPCALLKSKRIFTCVSRNKASDTQTGNESPAASWIQQHSGREGHIH